MGSARGARFMGCSAGGTLGKVSSSLAKLRQVVDDYDKLRRLDGCTPQSRGQQFNELIAELLRSQGIDAKANQRGAGEIDVIFTVDGINYVLEAKWLAEKADTGVIAKLQKRVSQRLVGTYGVLLSMSGFSPDALAEITDGQRLEILLFDQSHWEAMVNGHVTPARLLALARGHAAFRGESYVPLQTLLGSSLPMPQVGPAVQLAKAGSKVPDFGRLLLPRIVGVREIRDPSSGDAVAMYTDASILFYMIEHFVRVGAVDVAVNEGTYTGAIQSLPNAFRNRLVEIDRADSARSVLRICEPIVGEFDAEINVIDDTISSISYHTPMRGDVPGALAYLVFELGAYIQGMRHGLIVTLDLGAMRHAIQTLLEASSSRESRANLVTVEQIFSTYRFHEIGASIIKSTAPDRMVEIFDDLTRNPLYRELSHHAANMGVPGESAESVAAVTRTAKRLTDQDAGLNFGRYDAFIASSRSEAVANGMSEKLGFEYFPPIVPIVDAQAKARQAWQRDAPSFIPIGPDWEDRAIDLPPGTYLK